MVKIELGRDAGEGGGRGSGWPAARLILVFGALLIVGLVSCDDLTRPERDSPFPLPVAYEENGDSVMCVTQSSCTFKIVDDTEYCVCELDGITAAVDSGQGEPPAPPSEPEPPGWPPDDWMNWPTPPGTGGPPPPPGEPLCEPESFMNPCETFTASLSCPVDVTRGDTGTCTFEIDPNTALDGIIGWVFNGENLSVADWQHNEVTWEGQLVKSGMVTVHFQALGRVGKRTTRLGVQPRAGSAWEWWEGNGISYDEGSLANPPTPWPATRVAIICHPTQGCSTSSGVPQEKWYVQPQNFIHGNGFIRGAVSDGPNQGVWYLESVSVDVKTASAFNPDYFSGGVPKPQGCGGQDNLSFWDFNLSACGVNDPGWGSQWTDFAYDHEQIHADQIPQFLGTFVHQNVPEALEDVVLESASEVNDHVDAVVAKSGECVTAAASQHGYPDQEPLGHPLPTFEIWFWDTGQSAFDRWRPGDPRTGTPLDWAPYLLPPELNCDQPVEEGG